MTVQGGTSCLPNPAGHGEEAAPEWNRQNTNSGVRWEEMPGDIEIGMSHLVEEMSMIV